MQLYPGAKSRARANAPQQKNCPYPAAAGHKNNRRLRHLIGKCNEISLDDAKKQVCILLGDIAKGRDPKTGKRINALHNITLREVTEKYLEVRKLRAATQKNYRSSIYLHLKDWLDLPMNSITKDMVEQRHQDLTVAVWRPA